MNSNNSSPVSTTLECCVDYCETIFSGTAGPVVNAYACNQQRFTSAAMWQIHQERKSVNVSKGIQAITTNI